MRKYNFVILERILYYIDGFSDSILETENPEDLTS